MRPADQRLRDFRNRLVRVNARSGVNGSTQAPQRIEACSRVERDRRIRRPQAHAHATVLGGRTSWPGRSAWRHRTRADSMCSSVG
jgi:hypothetical protein